MGLDARSRARLEQLGRQLPQPLPQPEAAATSTRPSAGRIGRSHRLETETDPQALFRELMQASPDGTVPPHLLQRLRELEHTAPPPTGAPASAKARLARVEQGRDQGRDHDPLYVSFEQMLLEDESL